MTEKVLDWLNHNRFRAYPFVNDEGLICNGTRIPDCILLDCLVMDTRKDVDSPDLVFTEIDVTTERTHVSFKYNGVPYTHDLTTNNGQSSVTRVDGSSISGMDMDLVFMKMVFSSHDYILQNVGEGNWKFSGKVLPSKIISVPASGVSGISMNGSSYIEGFDSPGVAIGDVTLVDGFRTQPVIHNGKVVVKVGTAYGEDPCHYREDDPEYAEHKRKTAACDGLMFFFCGQNVIDNGNVSIEGGPGVIVKQGGTYTAKSDIIDTYDEIGIEAGETLPCIEVIAAPSLLKLYRPTVLTESE